MFINLRLYTKNLKKNAKSPELLLHSSKVENEVNLATAFQKSKNKPSHQQLTEKPPEN